MNIKRLFTQVKFKEENMIETGESSKFNTTIVCRNCGQRLDVGANDTVPPCPRCGNKTFDHK